MGVIHANTAAYIINH